MRILAYYADKDKENVYQTPGFNKTKNPNFTWPSYMCVCVCLFMQYLIHFVYQDKIKVSIM